MPVYYEWFKVLHIVGWLTWMFGLMRLLRFLPPIATATDLHGPVLYQENRATASRLYRTVATPGMLLTLAMGSGLVSTAPDVLYQAWFLAKLGFVALLIGFHWYFGQLIDSPRYTTSQIKRLHHVPGITLVPIVVLAVCKNALPTMPVAGFIFFAALLSSGWQLLSALFGVSIKPELED